MNNGNTITAIVPARKETNRLPNKNTLPFGKSNLLLHKLEQLKQVPEIDHIVVSSEDKEILQMAAESGVEAMRRPMRYADHSLQFGYFVEYVCGQASGEHILWTCVTAPFVTPAIYSSSIRLYLQKINEGYDSLISVQKMKRYILDANGSLNFRRGLLHKNSEDLSALYLYTNGIALASREKMIAWKYNWGHVPYMLEVDKRVGMNISDAYDYHIACLLEQEGNR